MTYIDNLARFLPITGPENGHLAHFFASIEWENEKDRDEFADALSHPWTG